ncbi:hypothetical protein GCM10009735_76880 [Actinomadura chokoriensis]
MTALCPATARGSASPSAAAMCRRVRSMPATPIGTLIRKTLGHRNAPTMMPPTVGPSAMDDETTADQTPSTFARSRASGKARTSSASELGMNSAAPAPCRSRAAISTSMPGASAEASDAKPKTPMPHR